MKTIILSLLSIFFVLFSVSSFAVNYPTYLHLIAVHPSQDGTEDSGLCSVTIVNNKQSVFRMENGTFASNFSDTFPQIIRLTIKTSHARSRQAQPSLPEITGTINYYLTVKITRIQSKYYGRRSVIFKIFYSSNNFAHSMNTNPQDGNKRSQNLAIYIPMKRFCYPEENSFHNNAHMSFGDVQNNTTRWWNNSGKEKVVRIAKKVQSVASGLLEMAENNPTLKYYIEISKKTGEKITWVSYQKWLKIHKKWKENNPRWNKNNFLLLIF